MRGNGSLGEILKEPDAPWIAFLKGAGWAAAATGLPIFLRVLFLPREGSDGFWMRFWICGAIVGVICLVSGTARAIWALIQRRAYDRVASGPFH
ncbi:hypothetical protein PMI01_01086 [Caulobacter sp. AP07]|nr:hypothetical protein PMI01_01086 [Caulobacter sp. AP07]